MESSAQKDVAARRIVIETGTYQIFLEYLRVRSVLEELVVRLDARENDKLRANVAFTLRRARKILEDPAPDGIVVAYEDDAEQH